MQAAVAQRALELQLKFKKAPIKHDRHVSLDGIASSAQSASERGDNAASYRLVRALGGMKPRALKGVRDAAGRILTDVTDAKLRWQECFTELFSAGVMREVGPLCRPGAAEVHEHGFHPTRADVSRALWQLNARKAAGRDGLCAAVLRTGGHDLVAQLTTLIELIIETECVPWQWRGGTILERFKGKGDPLLCEKSRGLLISDHAMKVLTSLLQKSVNPKYVEYISPDQFGAVPKCGAALASHMVRSYMDLARAPPLNAHHLH